MRTLLLTGLTFCACAGAAADAEARARIRFGGARARTQVTAPVVASVPSPALALRAGDGAEVRPTYVVLPPGPEADAAARSAPAAMPTATAPAKAAGEAAPWCRSQRVVGTGAGFCLIN